MDFISLLRTTRIEEVMSNHPLCVSPESSLEEVLARLRERKTGAAIVCREGIVAGIFTERDFLELAISERSFREPIERVMISDPVILSKNAFLAEAVRRMSVGRYRQLPIVDEYQRPAGILKLKSIVHFLVEHFPRAVYTVTANVPPVGREGA